MNQQQSNQLGQYTVPTTPKEQAFYSRHSGAITRYTIAVIGIQLAWSFFSYNPAMALLMENTTMLPAIQPFLPILAGGILGILHFVLKAETLETFSNIMDKDETTINGLWNYFIPVIVCVGLFILDVKGVSTTLRDKSFEGKKEVASKESKAELAKAKLDYDMSIAAINESVKEGVTAESLPFASKLAQARSTKTWDAQDVAAKNRKINAIAQQRDAAVTKVRTEANEAKKEALATYNKEKTRITGIVDSTHKSLDGQDERNAAKAESYSWGVSVFFMLIFLLMNYKLVYLRVNSGIRINKEFTQLDAEGSFLEKLQRVLTSIAQRQGHRFLVFFHKVGSTGTATLSTFDGRVILQQSSYNGSKIAQTTPSVVISNGDINGGSAAQAPPPMPPTPPAPPSTGNNGGGNGGDRTPSVPTAPVPAQTQPQTATASAVAVAKAPRFNDLHHADQFRMVEHLADTSGLSAANLLKACKSINPIVQTDLLQPNQLCPIPTHFEEIKTKCAVAAKIVEKYNPTIAKIPRPIEMVARHEVGHALTHMILCNALNVPYFGVSITTSSNNGGSYFHSFPKNSINNVRLAILDMAGFANESFQNHGMDWAYITTIEKESSDFKKGFEKTGDVAKLEHAFNQAKELLFTYQGVRIESFINDLLKAKSLDSDYLIKKYKEIFPTPSVETPKTPVTTVAQQNPVAQPVRTVPQPKPEKTPTLLDDKLQLLRSKILKYSASHFNNTQANDSTVAKAIFKLCDEAFLALKSREVVDKWIVKDFETAAKIRLQLCKDNGFEYDSFDELMSLLDKRKEGSDE